MSVSEVPQRRRIPGLSWYELVLEDKRPVRAHLRAAHPYTARTQHVPVGRDTSRAWHERERTHLRRKVWQTATPTLDAAPLETFLCDLPEHFAQWQFEDRYVQAHVAKRLRCNGKVAQEAFDDGLHLGATHPQAVPYVGDSNHAVDVYGNHARQISPSGTPIEDLPVDPSERDILARMLDVREGEDLPVLFEARSTARGTMSAAARERWRPLLGDAADEVSRRRARRPRGHVPHALHERATAARAGDVPRPRRAVVAPELQTLALVMVMVMVMEMDQDSFNMEAVQRGLQTTRRPTVLTSDFQEDVLSWRHGLLTTWDEHPAAQDGRP